MTIRYPKPLAPGDRIGVTAPSSGVPGELGARLEFCVRQLREAGYDVVVGECMDGSGVTSAPAAARAAELTEMLIDPGIRAVVPPWGGELSVDLLPHLDFTTIATAEPTWLVGYSDISTLLVSLTTLTGVATLHGQNLMDTPYRLPAEVRSWRDVAALSVGASFVQSETRQHRSVAAGFDRWQEDPAAVTYTLDEPGGWHLLDPDSADIEVSGRLIGGCIETVATIAGSPYGDLQTFAREQAPEGLVVYVEAAEDSALNIARGLWRMRLAGWFDAANAVLVGRTHAPHSPGYTQRDAVRDTLGDLGIPVVLDVDCGHVPPQLMLINGALATLRLGTTGDHLTQHLG